MSYTIEYNRKALFLPKGTKIEAGFGKIAHELWDNEYYLFIKLGCNNIYPRPKSWLLAAQGPNFQIIDKVCSRAGVTEGGGIKLNGKDTTPENYLKMYREVIKNAELFSIETMKRTTGVNCGDIFIGNKPLPDYAQKSFNELKANSEDLGRFLDDYTRLRVYFNDFHSWMIYMNYEYLGEASGGFSEVQSSMNE